MPASTECKDFYKTQQRRAASTAPEDRKCIRKVYPHKQCFPEEQELQQSSQHHVGRDQSAEKLMAVNREVGTILAEDLLLQSV